MKKFFLNEIIPSLFILLFLYTGIMKIIEHDIFEEALLKSPMLVNMAVILSYLIPSIELLIVISLLVPRTRRIGLSSSLFLMSVFTIYIAIMLYFRSDRPCTCGGVIKLMNWHQHLYFNIFFTLLALLSLRMGKDNKKGKENIEPTQYAKQIV